MKNQYGYIDIKTYIAYTKHDILRLRLQSVLDNPIPAL